jgi:hypothetical protein
MIYFQLQYTIRHSGFDSYVKQYNRIWLLVYIIANDGG